jgi:hypothetical protein
VPVGLAPKLPSARSSSEGTSEPIARHGSAGRGLVYKQSPAGTTQNVQFVRQQSCSHRFSTKNRLKIIREELQPDLWAYMAGIAKNHGMHALAIGGIADHAHALLDLGSTLGIAKAVQVLKANSSRWMNGHPGARF